MKEDISVASYSYTLFAKPNLIETRVKEKVNQICGV